MTFIVLLSYDLVSEIYIVFYYIFIYSTCSAGIQLVNRPGLAIVAQTEKCRVGGLWDDSLKNSVKPPFYFLDLRYYSDPIINWFNVWNKQHLSSIFVSTITLLTNRWSVDILVWGNGRVSCWHSRNTPQE